MTDFQNPEQLITEIYDRQDNDPDYVQYCQRIITATNRASDPKHLEIRGHALTCLGRKMIALCDYDRARELSQEALAIGEKINNIKIRANAHGTLGRVYSNNANYLEAIQHYEALYRIAQKNQYPALQVEGVVLLASTFCTLQENERALEYLNQAMVEAPTTNSDYFRALLSEQMGLIFNNMSQNKEALHYFDESQTYFKRINNDRGVASALMNKGLTYINLERYEDALACFQNSYDFRSQTNERLYLATTLHNMGLAYKHIKDYERALVYFEQARRDFQKNDQKHALVYNLLISGDTYNEVGDFEQASKFLQQALKLAETINSSHQIKIAYDFFYRLHKKRANLSSNPVDDLAKALDYHEKFLTLTQELFDEESDRRIQTLQTQFKLKEKDYENKIYRIKIEQQEQELTRLVQTLAQKNALIQRLQEYIQKIKRDVGVALDGGLTALSAEFVDVRHKEHDWQEFETKFNRVYRGFTSQLAKQYPALTPQELKVCALIKVGLTTKEIANFLYRSMKNVESHRYHIRQKLALHPGQNLISFLDTVME